MKKISMRQMLEAGAHFGHKTKYWNPKMEPYIYGERNGIHIINLETTLPQLEEACNYIKRLASESATILFVGTKQSIKDEIKRAGTECSMPYVSNRWLGGTLTNNATISKSIKKMDDLEESLKEENISGLTKKEVLTLTRSYQKLDKGLGGIREMKKLPDVLFIIDVNYEKNAVKEALVLGIPIIAIVDTNSSPEGINHVIASNDDSRSTAKFIMSLIIEAYSLGKKTIPILEDIDDEFVEVDSEGKISPTKIRRKKKIIIDKKQVISPAKEEPKVEAEAEEPKVEAEAEEPKVEAEAEEPKVEAEAEEPKVEAEAEEPKVEAEAEEPKVEAEAEEPKVEAEAEEPKVEAEAEEPKVEAEAEEPKVEAEAEEPKVEAEAEETTDKK